MKKNKETLDELLREKLERIHPSYQPESWDGLAQRLDDLAGGTPPADTDKALDETAFERLHQLDVPYQPHHWQQMAALLDREHAGARAVVRTKSAELLLLLLLLITLANLLPDRQPRPGPIAQQAAVGAQEEASQHTRSAQLSTTADALQTPSHQQPATKAGPAIAPSTAPPRAATGTTTYAVAAEAGLLRSSAPPATGAAHLPAPLAPLALLPIWTDEAATVVFPVSEVDNAEADTDTQGSTTSQEAPDKLRLLLPSPLAVPAAHLELPAGQRAASRLRHVRIGMMGAFDFNYIFTPAISLNNEIVGNIGRYAPGYGGGITIGFTKGRWEVETGAIYSAKAYQPLPIVRVSGSVRDGLVAVGYREFLLNTLQLPLTFRYNALRSSRWDLYALMGGSVHLLAQADYFVADQNSFDLNFTAPPEESAMPREAVQNIDPVGSEKAGAGLLQGGSLGRNLYVSAHVGLGMERHMSSYWSLFTQGQFHYTLLQYGEGIGPYGDRIHSASLMVGVKVRLGQAH